ncbi:hypothetical protein E2562_012949 [Oryza meyeriana var. granulata]|uniref:Uncharacterized protein n=1 Tax=Oryza meyeriana var. granulata TaxID=110450 RepID=A0A6G1DJX0_9ORYZ|nr:hypothetical protein E2562_012949 [Oryza meyeriana var. granulata]
MERSAAEVSLPSRQWRLRRRHSGAGDMALMPKGDPKEGKSGSMSSGSLQNTFYDYYAVVAC